MGNVTSENDFFRSIRRYFYLSTQLSMRLVYAQSVHIDEIKTENQISMLPTCLVQNNFMFLYRPFFAAFLPRRRLAG